MNRIAQILLATISSALMMASCEEELIGPQIPNTPSQNFEVFWKTFDEHYGLFEVKGIDWQLIHDQHATLVHDQLTDSLLYEVFKQMIIPLNDNHVNLYPTNGTLPVFPGGVIRYEHGVLSIKKYQEDFDLEVTKNYLTDFAQVSDNISFGSLPNNVGYVNIKGTDPMKQAEKAIDEALNALKDADALIVDVRGHYGGFDAVMQAIAGRFATGKQLYMTSRKRNGPSHDDFGPMVEWHVAPKGDYQFKKPIILLTSRFTQSAGETFTLAMKRQGQVTIVGDTTAGSFSDNPNFELPNGWIFSLSVGDYRDADGQSFEGIGLAPQVVAVTTKDELLAGKDSVLEKAMRTLKP